MKKKRSLKPHLISLQLWGERNEEKAINKTPFNIIASKYKSNCIEKDKQNMQLFLYYLSVLNMYFGCSKELTTYA